MELFVAVSFLSVVAASVVAAQSCRSQNVQDIIEGLLRNSDNGVSGSLMVSSYQTRCETLVHGNNQFIYHNFSIEASYRPTTGSETIDFQLQCQGFNFPLSDPLHTLCNQSACSSPTCPGSGYCPRINQCCSYYVNNGSCTNYCSEFDGRSISVGVSESTNFTCSK